MDKKEFKGEISHISPHKLIQKDKNNDFDNFFLVLGLIYNDLKDIIFFVDSFNKSYREPKYDGSEEPSVHLGQCGGIQNHINRLVIGLISEFFIFLEKNNEVTSSINFQLFIKKLPEEVRNDWFNLLGTLDNESEDFLSKIARIRSNIAFHYDQSLTELRSGFIEKFFGVNKDKSSEYAFYSLGGTMETTRFYYCDGSVEAYSKKLLGSSPEDNYFENVRDLIPKINKTIGNIMVFYLAQKNKK